MKITCIGTSHGVPEANRRCSSYLIEAQDKVYLIDMGTAATESIIARGIKPPQVSAVFITHPHGDHTDGLIQFVDLINWYFKTADPVIFVPNDRFEPAINAWLVLNGTTLRNSVQFRVTEPGVIWDDGVLRVTSCPTQHCPHSCAYLVECEGKTVLFTGDLRHPSVDYPEEAKRCTLDLAVCETAHFSPKEFLPIWETTDVKAVVHTHVSPRWHDDLDEIVAGEHKYDFCIAEDDMILEL
ncbi:MAG: ribonuclease Z [Clostridia bacterium]|nr:ribonuclease Z [Clostridia bacterium]